MDMSNNKFAINSTYEFHVQGFNEPVIGKIIDIEVSEEDILLVIQKSDKTVINIFSKFITGWSIQDDKRLAA